MRYTFVCEKDGRYNVESPINIGPVEAVCPQCGEQGIRDYRSDLPPVHYNAQGFSRDYFSRNPGRGQSWDKKENLNENWSKHYNEPPPPADSAGTYDGVPKK